MKTYINTAQITSIRRYNKRVNQEFVLHPEEITPATLFSKAQVIPAYVSRWSDVFDQKRYPLKEFLEKESDHIYEESGKLYDYPHLIIKMSDGNQWTEYFKSVQSLEDFLNNNLLNKIHTITV